MALDRPLAGIRVLDLSRLLPGPWCSQLLADLGADVIKVETPLAGDYARMAPAELGFGGVFEAVNRGKRSIAVNYRLPRGPGGDPAPGARRPTSSSRRRCPASSPGAAWARTTSWPCQPPHRLLLALGLRPGRAVSQPPRPRPRLPRDQRAPRAPRAGRGAPGAPRASRSPT